MLWQGFHQSLRPAKGQMLINLDVSATAFYQSGQLPSIIAKILNKNVSDLRQPLLDKDRIKLEKHLKGIKIVVTHRGNIRRKYRIVKLTHTSASKTSILVDNKDGNEYQDSVAGYFKSKYKITLSCPSLPCLVVGEGSKSIYLPIEVCDIIVGQRHLKKLNERQVFIINIDCRNDQIYLSTSSCQIKQDFCWNNNPSTTR